MTGIPAVGRSPAPARPRAGSGGDRGQISAGVAGVFVMLVVLAGLLFDPGMTIAARVAALDVAQAAARAGADQLDLTLLRTTGQVQIDPPAAHTAAAGFLQQTGTAGATVHATTEQVVVTISYQRPTVLLNMVGLDSLPVEVSATAQPRTGTGP